MKTLVTGAAGFIGYHLTQALLAQGHEVVGIDNLCASYDPKLKSDRLAILAAIPNFTFVHADISDKEAIERVFTQNSFKKLFHFAALGGVTASSANPHIYQSSNIEGFLNILEASRKNKVEHLVYASSSSVYGANTSLPQASAHPVDHPLSFYAVTKRTNELMAHSFSHLYQLPTTGLRFFTVYGPWGRPDMAVFRFTKAILESQPIQIFGDGKIRRDFTFISDAVAGILAAAVNPPIAVPPSKHSPDVSQDPFRIYNIGGGQPVTVSECLEKLEKILGKSAKKTFSPARPEDLQETYAEVSEAKSAIGFRAKVPLESGLQQFCDWYREHYAIK